MRRPLLIAAGAVAAVVLVAPSASVQSSAATTPVSKCLTYGPAFQGRSVIPTLKQLGVRVWQMGIVWPAIAPKRRANPSTPKDPVYRWPADVDRATRDAVRNGIEPV